MISDLGNIHEDMEQYFVYVHVAANEFDEAFFVKLCKQAGLSKTAVKLNSTTSFRNENASAYFAWCLLTSIDGSLRLV